MFGLAPTEVSGSGVLWKRLLAQSCSCGGYWLGPAPDGVRVSGLILQRLLTLPGPTVVAGSGLLPRRSLPHHFPKMQWMIDKLLSPYSEAGQCSRYQFVQSTRYASHLFWKAKTLSL